MALLELKSQLHTGPKSELKTDPLSVQVNVALGVVYIEPVFSSNSVQYGVYFLESALKTGPFWAHVAAPLRILCADSEKSTSYGIKLELKRAPFLLHVNAALVEESITK